MSKKTILITSAIVIGLIVLLIILKKSGTFGENVEAKEVEFVKINQTTIVETVSATGKIQPEVQVNISSEVSGEITALAVKEVAYDEDGPFGIVKLDVISINVALFMLPPGT